MTRLFFIQLIRPMCPFVLLDLRCGFIALDSLMRAGLVYAGKADVSQPTTHNPLTCWHKGLACIHGMGLLYSVVWYYK